MFSFERKLLSGGGFIEQPHVQRGYFKGIYRALIKKEARE